MVVSDSSLREENQPFAVEMTHTWEYSLGLKLIRQDKIRLPEKRLVLWDFVFWNVQLPVVPHHRVKHCVLSALFLGQK